MDTIDIARVCKRRWYIFLPIFVLSIVVALYLKVSSPPTWVGTGQLTLVYHRPAALSANAPDPLTLNSLGSNNGVLLESVLIADLNSATTQKELGSPKTTAAVPGSTAGGSFLVELDQSSQLVTVSCAGKNPTDVLAVVNRVMAAAPQRAKEIQTHAGVAQSSQMTTFVAVPPAVDSKGASGTKLMVASAGVGIAVGAALSLLLDGITRRRGPRSRRRRGARRQERLAHPHASEGPAREPQSPADPADSHVDLPDQTPTEVAGEGLAMEASRGREPVVPPR